MLNFDFQNPTRIVFGQGSIAKLDKLVPEAARVLILSGGGSAARNGTLDEVRTALGKRSLFEFAGVEPNPAYETLLGAVELARREQVDFLLAVGGGSVIDGTKFVAGAIPLAGDPWEILTSGGKAIKEALPFGTVLTLPATGSEMNNGSVITRKATQDKLPFSSRHVFPQFSLLDPTRTFSLPARQVANGIVDAFVHVVEQYVTYPADAKVQDRFAEGLLLTLIETGPQTLIRPDDYAARANLMWTATMALNGLIAAGVPQDWATHLIGHELTALYGLDHARTLAIVLPAMLHVRREAKREKLLQYAERVWGIASGNEAERIDTAIARTREFFEGLGIKTRLVDYGLGPEVIEAVIARLQAHGMVALGERREITPEVVRAVLQGAL